MTKQNIFILLWLVLLWVITFALNYPTQPQIPQNYNAENGGGFVVPNP